MSLDAYKFQRREANPDAAEPEPVSACPDCGSPDADTRYMVHKLGLLVRPERICENEFHDGY